MRRGSFLSISHTITIPSLEPKTARLPSADNATAITLGTCPPKITGESSQSRFHSCTPSEQLKTARLASADMPIFLIREEPSIKGWRPVLSKFQTRQVASWEAETARLPSADKASAA